MKRCMKLNKFMQITPYKVEGMQNSNKVYPKFKVVIFILLAVRQSIWISCYGYIFFCMLWSLNQTVLIWKNKLLFSCDKLGQVGPPFTPFVIKVESQTMPHLLRFYHSTILTKLAVKKENLRSCCVCMLCIICPASQMQDVWCTIFKQSSSSCC